MAIGEPLTLESMKRMVGRELGVSGWVAVGQDRIDAFAECTGDRQWIHIDAERARNESPSGSTIAHGYLTLSLVAALSYELGAVPENARAAINYGLDRVRFLNPVRAGQRIRLRSTLSSMEERGPGVHLAKWTNTVEIEGDAKPAMVAETLVMLYEGDGIAEPDRTR